MHVITSRLAIRYREPRSRTRRNTVDVVGLPIVVDFEAVAAEVVVHVGGLQNAVETHGAAHSIGVGGEDRARDAGDGRPEECVGWVGGWGGCGRGKARWDRGHGLSVLVWVYRHGVW
jgi:hypothetical protein